MKKTALYPEKPILIVDDEPAWTHSLSLSLKISAGINHTLSCHDSRNVMPLLQREEFCMVLLDLTMPHVCGEELLENMANDYPELPVIVISGMNQIETAIRCVRAGAADFYVKTDDRERVVGGIQRTLKQYQLQRENRRLAEAVLKPPGEDRYDFHFIKTKSEKMQAIYSYLRAIAGSREPLLISGESGVGKELLAREFHRLCCADKPLVAVNVAGLDDTVFSDTLFGHSAGAFTGADRPRQGMIEKAADGILLLDEIGDLSAASQVKLLRLLQEGEYYPLGCDQAKKTKARIVAATNQDLSAKEAQGGFRRDLLFRLRSHHIVIPPLRRRPEDISLLLDYFLSAAATEMRKNKPALSAGLLPLLTNYSFPGNVRELRSMAYDALSVHQRGMLSPGRFKEAMSSARQPFPPLEDEPAPEAAEKVRFCEILPTLKEVSRLLIDEALRRTNGNQSAAARLLGVTPQALSKRLK